MINIHVRISFTDLQTYYTLTVVVSQIAHFLTFSWFTLLPRCMKEEKRRCTRFLIATLHCSINLQCLLCCIIEGVTYITLYLCRPKSYLFALNFIHMHIYMLFKCRLRGYNFSRGLIFAGIYFRESPLVAFGEYLFSRITKFRRFGGD